MYNCLPLVKTYAFTDLYHGTMDWIATVTGWDRFTTFFPSSGAPPASANLMANYNAATYANVFGVDWGDGWQGEEPWDQEWHPICGKLNSDIEAPCEMGSDCGGQMYDSCGSACPDQCGAAGLL
jgi:hypothetical protein